MYCGNKLGLLAAVAAIFFAVPGVASAYQVTVHVHGAGLVTESTARNLMNCDVSPAGSSEASVFNCVAGNPSGGYAFGDIVQLDASVPEGSTAFARGWRFLKWVDSSSSGQINCDPQGTTGDMFTAGCRFQIFDNLQTNLYFDDVHGPTDTSLSDAPTSPTKQTTAAFTFNAPSDPDATFECKLDRPGLAGSFVTCGGPLDKGENYSGLTTNGQYTLSFRSKDPSGNIGNPFFTRSWVVDTVAPVATIGGGPAQGTTVTTNSAAFTVGHERGRPADVLDRRHRRRMYVGLGGDLQLARPGSAHLHPHGDRSGGQRGASSRNWTVDTVAPDAPNITSGPDAPTSSRSAIFAFTGPGDAASFRCQLDTGPWRRASRRSRTSRCRTEATRSRSPRATRPAT